MVGSRLSNVPGDHLSMMRFPDVSGLVEKMTPYLAETSGEAHSSSRSASDDERLFKQSGPDPAPSHLDNPSEVQFWLTRSYPS